MSKLIEKLLEIQKELPTIPKNRTAKVKMKSGGEFSYKYADFTDIMAVVLPALNKHGLFLSQPGVVVDGKQVLRTVLSDNETQIESDFILPHTDDPQEMGATITYFRRYALISMLGMVTDEDVDGPPKGASKPAQAAVNPPQSASAGGYKGYGDTVSKEAKPVTEPQLRRMRAIQHKAGMPDDALKQIIKGMGLESSKQLNQAQYDIVCSQVESYGTN